MAERFEVGDDLPAPLDGHARPRWHARSEIAVAKEPDELSGRGVLYTWRMEVGSVAEAAGVFSVTFGAVLVEKFFAGEEGIRIVFIGIFPIARLSGSLGDGANDAAVIGGMFVSPVLVSVLRNGAGSRGKRGEEESGWDQGGLHRNRLLTLWPKPEIS